nr:serine palmitoyltransferase 2 [Seculamonas ecuadoriensis]
MQSTITTPVADALLAQEKARHVHDAAADVDRSVPLWVKLLTYSMYAGMFVLGYLLDLFLPHVRKRAVPPKGYAPLLRDFEEFWNRHAYKNIHDCWNRPICSVPGERIDVIERVPVGDGTTLICSKNVFKGRINLGSYNYLGFAETSGRCIDSVVDSLDKYGISTCGPVVDIGYTDVHKHLEEKVARFVGKEAALVVGMGFATNSTIIPALGSKGTLIISDSLNHASLIIGTRGSRAKTRVFKHNDIVDLERIIRESIRDGQPRTHYPWERIVIIVEGIYSMEGDILNLPAIVAIKKRYKCYLYVDEAHSIGALGKSGRGVCEYHGVDPSEVDILMGTFTKSFGSVGGYVAGSRELIDYLRSTTFGSVYACSMAPGCARMIISAFETIIGEDGTNDGKERIRRLAENANYFRDRMTEMGFVCLGNHDSPIVPVLTYVPSIMPAFSRECLKRGVAIVVVGFPATGVLDSRVRFCISAAHSRETLDEALAIMDELGDACLCKFATGNKAARRAATERLARARKAKGLSSGVVASSSSSATAAAVASH